ncbi:MAG TPA: hypothetical protein VF216_00640 [Mizugakiibacter sp.]
MADEERILALLAKMHETQEQMLAIQRQAYESQQQAIANQQLAVRNQMATGRLYRVALLVAAGVLGFLIFQMLPYFR